jgi:uncharacterized protein YbjT (DUF2867 family)
MRVLVLGASGFIGLHLAIALKAAGHQVLAGSRRRSPAFETSGLSWIQADFARLSSPEAWRTVLADVDAVVNCVGVLQDAPGDSTRLAHETGPEALFHACETAGVQRVIHISAVGADEAAGTEYAISKLGTERWLAATGLNWIVLRPSLVTARTVYGGTALLRGLAGFPGVTPVLGGAQVFRPVTIEDLGQAVRRLLEPGAPSSRVLEIAGPEPISLVAMLRAYRRWLGFGPAPIVRVPGWAAWPLIKAGDLVALLGWTSSFRSTAVRQMNHAVEGDAETWTAMTGVQPVGFSDGLAAQPASVQDRWHARLFFLRPLAVIVLGLFWVLVGVLGLVTPARPAAAVMLEEAGFGSGSQLVSDLGHSMDLALGLALFFRRWTRAAALAMVAVCLVYLTGATIWFPHLWLDPLAPWLKVFPVIVLGLLVAATDDRR